jgi:uncharacterized Zn finger protein
MGYRDKYDKWPKYVPVAEKKQKAEKKIASLKKKGAQLHPIVITGRSIAKTFWGKAWCTHLESYSDYSNRLPRGRTYVRNGSVIDLQISKGLIKAQVIGSSLYQVTIDIQKALESKWISLIKACTGKIDSLIELLQGNFSKNVMEIITEKEGGLFPSPKEISLKCSCPDYAGMCKHVAAVLYGVGALLDEKPQHLFTLRHVDPMDLISIESASNTLLNAQNDTIEEDDLSSLFGIEMELEEPKPTPKKTKKSSKKKA